MNPEVQSTQPQTFSASKTSVLLQFPPEIFSGVTDFLAPQDILELFMAVDPRIRHAMTKKSGIKQLAYQPIELNASFPLFPARFMGLEKLSISQGRRFWKSFTLGSMSTLPPTLTHLDMSFWCATTCWLQPSNTPGNNDDEEWTKSNVPYKPIYLDQLLPRLRILRLAGGQEHIFSPNGYPDPPFRSLFSRERISEILSVPEFQMDIKWTPQMRIAWLDHLPVGLDSLVVPSFNVSHVDLFRYAPLGLSEMRITGESVYCRLSSLPSALQDTLLHLQVSTGTTEVLDAPFPRNLLSFQCQGYQVSFSGVHPLLPPTLTSLKVTSQVPLDSFISLPPRLIILQCRLAQTPTPTDMGCLPSGLESLDLSGDVSFDHHHVLPLPRGLTHLALNDSAMCFNADVTSFVQALPSTLLTLELGTCSTNFPATIMEHLPPNLHSLKLNSAVWAANSVVYLPPQLRSIWLPESSFPDTVIPLLPPNFRLRVHTIVATGILLPIEEKEMTTSTLTASIRDLIRRTPGSTLDTHQYISASTLSFIPDHVTSINVSCSSVKLGRYSPDTAFRAAYDQPPLNTQPPERHSFPNLTSLVLDSAHSLNLSFLMSFPNLTSLDAARCYQINDDAFLLNKHKILPDSITRIALPSCNGAAIFIATNPLPSKLKCLKLTNFPYTEFAEKLLALEELETLQFTTSGFPAFIPPRLPRNVTDLEVGGYRIKAQIQDLPPKLKRFKAGMELNDEDLQQLPKTLTSLSCHSIQWRAQQAIHYTPSEEKEFHCPRSLTDLARDLRFRDSTHPELALASTAPSSNETVLSEADSETPKKENWLRHLTTESSGLVDIDLHRFLSPHLETLTFACPTNATIISQLPKSLLTLDLSTMTTLADNHIYSLPHSITSLALHGGEMTADILMHLPPALTNLSFLKLLGRVTAARASCLPQNLITLRLGCCLLGDDAAACLPRSITDLSAPNCAILTDKGLPHLPPALKKLAIPTCRITFQGAKQLPSSITSLNYGTACPVPAPVVVEHLKGVTLVEV